jgi:hypothetical protein
MSWIQQSVKLALKKILAGEVKGNIDEVEI